MTETELDSLVTNTEAAVVLGCVDRIGQITYRQALDEYQKRFARYMDFVDDIFGK